MECGGKGAHVISSEEMKKGLVLDIEGEAYIVLDWQRISEAQVNVVLRMKLRHLRTHALLSGRWMRIKSSGWPQLIAAR
jgi:translation elongation factor P/translation initiation factor 5A